MKTKSDPRHIKRIRLMQELFSWNFSNVNTVSSKSKPIVDNLKKIDKLIAQSAPDRPVEQINRVDLAILRLAIFELIIKKGTPPKVVVDEAIELAKEFGAQSSPGFINGVLGKLIESEKII
ncbi:transcription antitermination factor NusB [Candidatus Daviesbacteria bacterium]|nr:transcription antitermination factor NusB [Candidatus Daviesbacteria bacterium]